MSLKLLLRKPAAQAVWMASLLFGLAGCSSSVYGPVGPAPADSVTFPAASTQGWLQQYGTGYVGTHSRNGDTAYGVATDLQGNVIVLDETYGAFPGFTNTGSSQFGVAKFNSTGTLVWTQQFGTGAGDYPNAITTDPQGNIYVGGFTNGAFSGFTNSGPQQSVVIKLNSSGQTQWIQQFASYGPSQATSLSVDPQGNLIVGGVNVVRASNGGRVQLGYVSKLAGATGAVMWTQGNSSGGVYYFVTGVSADPSGKCHRRRGFPGHWQHQRHHVHDRQTERNEWNHPMAAGTGHVLPVWVPEPDLHPGVSGFAGRHLPGRPRCQLRMEPVHGCGIGEWHGHATMAADIWRVAILRPGQCGCRYLRQCSDGRQHVSPLLFQHQPGGNERCLCGQAELDWSGSVAAAVWQRERHSLGNVLRLGAGLCGNRCPEPRLCGGNYDGSLPQFYECRQREYVVCNPVRAISGNDRERNQACSNAAGLKLFGELVAEMRYPAFSSRVTERSRFWTMSAVISISLTFLLLGR